jgi:hypothetical protein
MYLVSHIARLDMSTSTLDNMTKDRRAEEQNGNLAVFGCYCRSFSEKSSLCITDKV